MRVCPRCRSVYSKKTQFCGIDGERLTDQVDDPLVGRELDRYQVVEKLGQGASGCVYRARHSQLETDFAIKVLFGDLGSDETVVGRFRREAQTASKIRSPNIVSVVDFSTTPEGLTYLVMEYANGKSLRSVIREQAPLNPLRCARILAQISRALAAAHRLGFVHRDVKPANIVVGTENGQEIAKLLDFGIVRIQEEGEEATKLTQVGLVVGTPAYMAPEQAQVSDVTPAADIYALGVVLYEMLAGKKPFSGSSVPEIVAKHAQATPPPLANADGDLQKLAMQMLEKKPVDRPQSAVILASEADRIQTLLSGSSTSQAPTDPTLLAPSVISSSSERSLGMLNDSTSGPALLQSTLAGASSTDVGPPKSSKLPLVIGGVVLLLGLGAGGWLMSQKEQPLPPPPPPKVDYEALLTKTLESRGLSVADLVLMPEAQQYLSPRKPEKLVEVVKNAPLTQNLLRSKLDRLDQKLAGLPEGQSRKKLEERYLELYKQVNETRTPEGLADVSRSIHRFAKSLE